MRKEERWKEEARRRRKEMKEGRSGDRREKNGKKRRRRNGKGLEIETKKKGEERGKTTENKS